MRKETLKALGINVSEDVNAGDLLRMQRDELMEPETAYRIGALRELCEEFCDMRASKVKLVTTSGDAAKVLAPHLKCLDHEECWVLYLNRANRVIGKERLSSGGPVSTVVDTGTILRKALERKARGIILAHNHPSGSPYPGQADIKETQALKEASGTLGISLLDHVIFSDLCYYSFADESVSHL